MSGRSRRPGPNPDATLLRVVGEAVWGREWQTALGIALGPRHPTEPREAICDRTVRYWASGGLRVSPWVLDALPGIVAERRAAAVDAVARIGAVAVVLEEELERRRAA